jgi:hypothetical protein
MGILSPAPFLSNLDRQGQFIKKKADLIDNQL